MGIKKVEGRENECAGNENGAYCEMTRMDQIRKETTEERWELLNSRTETTVVWTRDEERTI